MRENSKGVGKYEGSRHEKLHDTVQNEAYRILKVLSYIRRCKSITNAFGKEKKKKIDVWWEGDGRNLGHDNGLI